MGYKFEKIEKLRKKTKTNLKTNLTPNLREDLKSDLKSGLKSGLKTNLGKMLLKAEKKSKRVTEESDEKFERISGKSAGRSVGKNSGKSVERGFEKGFKKVFDKTNRKLVYVNTINNFGMEKSLSVDALSSLSFSNIAQSTVSKNTNLQNTNSQNLQKAFFSYSDSMKIMNYYMSNAMMNNTDTVWFLEYGNCYTCGVSTSKDEMDSLNKSFIPVYKTNRGGKVTYHGLGQLIVYFIMNIKELNLNYDKLLSCIQDATINSLKILGITGHKKSEAFPNAIGIWVENKKIASIGLRIQNGISHHGIAINISPDLKFFDYIVPCGLNGVQMTSCRELSGSSSIVDVSKFSMNFGMNNFNINSFCEHFFKLFYESICSVG